MKNLTISDAKRIAEEVKTEDLSALTPERAEEITSAFGKLVELNLTAVSVLKGVEALTSKEYNDVVAATGVSKIILALKAGKTVKESNLITAVAKLANGRLQNSGDTFEIETPSFKIKFSQLETAKDDYDTDELRKLAGYDVSATFVNDILKDCFAEPVAKLLPKKVDDHILKGDVPASLRTTNFATDIVISVGKKIDVSGKEDKE